MFLNVYHLLDLQNNFFTSSILDLKAYKKYFL